MNKASPLKCAIDRSRCAESNPKAFDHFSKHKLDVLIHRLPRGFDSDLVDVFCFRFFKSDPRDFSAFSEQGRHRRLLHVVRVTMYDTFLIKGKKMV